VILPSMTIALSIGMMSKCWAGLDRRSDFVDHIAVSRRRRVYCHSSIGIDRQANLEEDPPA
jgi:hypothetical protein